MSTPSSIEFPLRGERVAMVEAEGGLELHDSSGNRLGAVEVSWSDEAMTIESLVHRR